MDDDSKARQVSVRLDPEVFRQARVKLAQDDVSWQWLLGGAVAAYVAGEWSPGDGS